MLDFKEIDREFRSRVTRYLGRLVGQTEAQDLAQETMIRIYRGLGSFNGDSTLATWIYRIATNTALDWQKSAYVRRNASRAPIHDGQLQERQSKDPPADESAIREEMRTCIRQFVGELTEKNRVALCLSEFEKLPVREIADVLGISYENAKIRVFRSRQALRKLLSDHCEVYRDTDFNLACEPVS